MPSQGPQIRIPISEQTRRKLKRFASDQGVSVAELIRNIVKDKLAEADIDIFDGVEAWGGDRSKEKKD